MTKYLAPSKILGWLRCWWPLWFGWIWVELMLGLARTETMYFKVAFPIAYWSAIKKRSINNFLHCFDASLLLSTANVTFHGSFDNSVTHCIALFT